MLHKLQTCFLKGIYDKNAAEDVYFFIQETADRTAAQQLNIYRGSIYGGLKKALAETYPVTKSLVGEAFFNAMLSQYITEYPCRVQDLNDYGETLAKFIQALKQACSLPYLSDMAGFEWFYNIALNAKVQENNLAEIGHLSSEQQVQMKLSLPKGSALLQSKYRLDEIWRMHQNNRFDTIELLEQDVFLIIWKNQLEVEIDRLSREQFYFLEKINSGLTFIDVCDAFSKAYPEADIESQLAEAFKNSWIQSYTVSF
ncbi:putative DNA-binding domain-containing protein [Beggiatoa alba]|nr:putative DNA-binding domain-containing protein [Beggiatoa alba]